MANTPKTKRQYHGTPEVDPVKGVKSKTRQAASADQGKVVVRHKGLTFGKFQKWWLLSNITLANLMLGYTAWSYFEPDVTAFWAWIGWPLALSQAVSTVFVLWPKRE